MSKQTFKETFCEHFQCSPELYVREALDRSFYSHARRFIPLLLLMEDQTILDAIALLEDIGKTKDTDEFNDALNNYDESRHKNWIYEQFRIRLSCERLVVLHYSIKAKRRSKTNPASESKAE